MAESCAGEMSRFAVVPPQKRTSGWNELAIVRGSKAVAAEPGSVPSSEGWSAWRHHAATSHASLAAHK